MWCEKYALLISCILLGIISRQQSIGFPKNCTLKVRNEKCNRSIIKTTLSDQECKQMVVTPTSYAHLSDFSMESFFYRTQYMNNSNINMTFSKIEWHYLKIRLKPRETRKNQFCQQLELVGDIPFSKETQVQLHCEPFYEDNEVIDTEYVTCTHNKMESKSFSMKVPNWNHIKNDSTCKNWELFMYIDTSNIPKLTVYWQNAPTHLGIKSYILNMTNADTGKVVRSVQVPTLYPLTTRAEDFTELYSGKFYFTIEAKCDNTKGYISKSAEVRIDLPSHMYLMLIAGGTGTIISLLLLIWALKNLTAPDEPPVVLILYEATRSAHVEALLAFASFLWDACYVKAKIDEVDIPLSSHKDPFVWHQETFSQADAVMVVSSPPRNSSDDVGIYNNLDKVGLNLLTEHFCEKEQKCFCVILPYCNKDDIPEKVISLQRFTLLRDLDDMLKYLRERRKFPKLFSLHFLRRCLPPKSTPGLCFDRTILANVFEKAGNELQKPSSPNTDIRYENILGHIPVVEIQPISCEGKQTSYSDDEDGSAYPELIDDILGQNEEEKQQLSETEPTLDHNDVPEPEHITYLDLS